MNKMQQQTITVGSVFKKTMGAMAKAAGALGVAMGATEMFKSFINSTQTMGDKWENTMVAAKASYQSFATSVMSGNADLIRNFRSLISAANEFAEASDSLGSAQISQRYSRLTYLNPLNQALVNAQEKGISPEQKKAYLEEAKGYYNEYSASVKNVAEKARAEMLAWLKVQLPGYNITEQNMMPIVDNLYKNVINGIYDATTKRYLEVTSKDFWKGNSLVNSQAQRQKAGESVMLGEGYTRQQIAVAKMIAKQSEIPDERLNENLDILETEVNATAELISLQRRINRAINGEGGGGLTGTGATTPALTEAQLMEYLSRKMQNEILAGDRAKDSMVIDFEIPEEEIIEEDTEAIVEAVIKARMEMELLAQTTVQALNAASQLGAAFTNMGRIAEGTLGDVFTMLGAVVSQIAQTVSAMMTLAGAETVEGVADLFANTPGLLFTKLAVAGAGLAGILGIIASAKSAFAGSYAQGGIVPGTSYSGDKLFARVNSGEMILNRNQQAALLNGGGQVRFVIEGSQLKGVLDNYEAIESL